ncbi:hypothetical protein [Nocardioides sp.]|uniref:hypothetical protein n=1 Tax=Nocardioides sp. TaxID=35761 RepID=UPI002B272324|nr:hypothetical protein [Nocardioides sp.]
MTSPSWRPEVLVALVVLVALALGAAAVSIVVVLRAEPPAVSSAPAPDPVAAPARGPAREVLRAWDRRRAAAWAAEDAAALAELYLPRAEAGRRDVTLLRRWKARGVRVTRLQPQVLALRVVEATDRRLVVEVSDRLGVVEAVVGGAAIALPIDRATSRRIELRRGPGVRARWKVASVLASPGGGLPAPGTLEP